MNIVIGLASPEKLNPKLLPYIQSNYDQLFVSIQRQAKAVTVGEATLPSCDGSPKTVARDLALIKKTKLIQRRAQGLRIFQSHRQRVIAGCGCPPCPPN